MQLYYGATVLGEGSLKWPSECSLAASIEQAVFWKLACVRQLGNDVCMEYERDRTGQSKPSAL